MVAAKYFACFYLPITTTIEIIANWIIVSPSTQQLWKGPQLCDHSEERMIGKEVITATEFTIDKEMIHSQSDDEADQNKCVRIVRSLCVQPLWHN
jgi:hypothetical protein